MFYWYQTDLQSKLANQTPAPPPAPDLDIVLQQGY